MFGFWVRIVILVALASLVLPRWTFPRTASVFRAATWHTARDGSDYDGAAHTGSLGIEQFPFSLWLVSLSGDGFSDCMAASGAVLAAVSFAVGPDNPGELAGTLGV